MTSQPDGHADRTYPGRGVDLCRVCGEPTRDHEMKPCPKLDVEVLYAARVAGVHQERADGACVNCGKPARPWVGRDVPTTYCSELCRNRRNAEKRRRRRR